MKGYSKENHHDDDHQLIRQSIQGDLSAFRELVESCQQYVYSLAFKSLLHKEDAENDDLETSVRKVIRENPEKLNTYLTFLCR